MHASKLIEIIQVLDKKEIKKLQQYLNSPFCHPLKQKKKAKKLLTFLTTFHPEFKPSDINKEKVFFYIFNTKTYANNKMDKLMARLLKAIKNFLTLEQALASNSKFGTELSLAKFYQKKGLNKSFDTITKNTKRKLNQTKFRDKAFYRERFQLENIITGYQAQKNSRTGDINLPNTLYNLDVQYLLEKLEYACWALSQSLAVAFTTEQSLALLDKTIADLPIPFYENIPLLKLYLAAYNLLRYGEEKEDWRRLDQLLTSYESEIPRDQLLGLQGLLRGHLILNFDTSSITAAAVFEIYKKHLQAGYLYYQAKLFPGTVKNLVNLGLKAKAFDWVKKFLEDHRLKIFGSEQSEDVYLFNMAEYNFASKNYQQTLALIANNYEDAYYKIAARRLELKVYFETQHDLLENKITSFKVLIHRLSKKNLPEIQYLKNNNFINLLRQLNSPQLFKNKAKIEKLIEKISKTKSIADREWLLERLQYLQ